MDTKQQSREAANSRKQEKIGWIGGWGGGFIWVLILSLVSLVRGRVTEAVIGLLICCAAGAAIAFFAPWRHPRRTYRVLMLPIYAVLLAALAWAAWSMDGLRSLGINNGWGLFILLPVLLPLWIAGPRRWADGE